MQVNENLRKLASQCDFLNSAETKNLIVICSFNLLHPLPPLALRDVKEPVSPEKTS